MTRSGRFVRIVRSPEFLMLVILVALNVFFSLTVGELPVGGKHLQHAEAVGHGHHRGLRRHDPTVRRGTSTCPPAAPSRRLAWSTPCSCRPGMALWPAAVIAMLCGLAVGMIQRAPGVVPSSSPPLPPLGMMYVALGLALILAKGTPVRGEKIPLGIANLARGGTSWAFPSPSTSSWPSSWSSSWSRNDHCLEVFHDHRRQQERRLLFRDRRGRASFWNFVIVCLASSPGSSPPRVLPPVTRASGSGLSSTPSWPSSSEARASRAARARSSGP